MKKLYLTGMMLAIFMPAIARQLNPDEALARVNSPLKSSVKEGGARGVKATTGKASEDAVYLFPTTDNGLLIVSGDDQAPALLGYVDCYDPANVPPAFDYWLRTYANQIKEVQQGAPLLGSGGSTDGNFPAPVSPLLSCRWNQDSPYNDLCPYDRGQRSMTGCVATAMAQAIYRFQWPPQGRGENSYTGNGATLSMDFGRNIYDWENMLPDYTGETTPAQREAVALLMYSCGISVNMNYGAAESGASATRVAPALYKYFRYDQSMATVQRGYYTGEEWENLIYEQLAAGRPVPYCGNSASIGHEFVCDGYQDGYFHINWGWGGMSDGYFLLSALEPASMGIGGGMPGEAFNISQDAIINMMPEKEDSKPTPILYLHGNIRANGSGDEVVLKAGNRLTITSTSDISSVACVPIQIVKGMKIERTDGSGGIDSSMAPIYITDNVSGTVTVNSGGWISSIGVVLPSGLADGIYRITPVCRLADEEEWWEIRGGRAANRFLIANVVDDQYNITPAGEIVAVANVDFTTPLYAGSRFEAEITFDNTGKGATGFEYYIELYRPTLNEQTGKYDYEYVTATKAALANIAADTMEKMTYASSWPEYVYLRDQNGILRYVALPEGEYRLVIANSLSGNKLLDLGENFVWINAKPAVTDIKASVSLASGERTMYGDEAEVVVEATCTEGYYNDFFMVGVYTFPGNELIDARYTSLVYIPKGETQKTSTMISTAGSTASQFNISAFKLIQIGDRQIQLEEIASLRVIKRAGDSGVDIVETDDDRPAVYYNLQGIPVANPIPGQLYILNGRKIIY